MKLKSITILGFRGFNENQTLTLDNDVILIYGLNGTGKSGLVEAIEWLFYDDISRKTRSLCKSEYTSDAIRNIHYDGEDPPFVELIVVKDGNKIILKKELISATKCNFYIDNNLVPDFSSLNVSFDDIHKPILGQSEIKRFVDTEQKDRWEEISKILGLENIADIREQLLKLRKEIENDSKFQELNDLKNSIGYDLKAIGNLEEYANLLDMTSYDKERFDKDLIKYLKKKFSQTNDSIGYFKKLLEDKLNLILKMSSTSENIKKLNYIQDEEFEKSIPELIKKARELIKELNLLKDFKFEEVDFFRKGIELIDRNICPFCGEKTITETKKEHLIKCFEGQKEKLNKYESYSELRKDLIKLKEELFDRFSKMLISSDELNLMIEDFSKYPEYKDIIKKLKDFSDINLKEFFDKINTQSVSFDGFIKLLETLPKDEESLSKCQNFVDSIEKELSGIIALSIKHGNDINKIKDELLLKTPGLSEDDKKSLNTVQAILKIINNRSKLNLFGVYTNNLDNITSLINKVEEFEKNKAENLLKHLSSSIKKYYNELNPKEKITFDEIKPSSGKSRKAKIKGTSFGKEINPVSCFSEAHTNCLGLSLYFPQRVDNNPDWNFILLDDPVQSMDINHSKNLIRILKRLSSNKQIIVLSHSHSFKQDFEDLFYGKDYLSYEFSDYQKEGPKITLVKGSIDNCLDFAKKLANGTQTERHTAGSNVRKALENFTAEILIQKGKLSSPNINKMTLEERLIKIEELGLCSVDDIGEIKALLNVVDSASHGRPRRDISNTEILDGIELIEKLKQHL